MDLHNCYTNSNFKLWKNKRMWCWKPASTRPLPLPMEHIACIPPSGVQLYTILFTSTPGSDVLANERETSPDLAAAEVCVACAFLLLNRSMSLMHIWSRSNMTTRCEIRYNIVEIEDRCVGQEAMNTVLGTTEIIASRSGKRKWKRWSDDGERRKKIAVEGDCYISKSWRW